VARWNPATKDWEAVSQPAGTPLSP
jgi:hypothetical protein